MEFSCFSGLLFSVFSKFFSTDFFIYPPCPFFSVEVSLFYFVKKKNPANLEWSLFDMHTPALTLTKLLQIAV